MEKEKVKSTLAMKILAIMEEAERIPKNGENTAQGYKYVMEADVKEGVRKLFIKHKVIMYSSCESTILTPNIAYNGKQHVTTTRMKYTLVDVDSGDREECFREGQGSDGADKGIFKSYTGAIKYFLMELLLLPSGDDPERDSAKPQNEDEKLALKFHENRIKPCKSFLELEELRSDLEMESLTDAMKERLANAITHQQKVFKKEEKKDA